MILLNRFFVRKKIIYCLFLLIKIFLFSVLIGISTVFISKREAFAYSGVSDFRIDQITVEGANRLQKDAVLNFISAQKGDVFTQELSVKIIKDLFATGFFSDAKTQFDQGVLRLIVQERPLIEQIDFVGIKEFSLDEIKKVFKESGLGTASVYDPSVLTQALQALKQQYLTKGKYATEIISTTTPLSGNRVSLFIAVNESEVTTIREIKIIGNRQIDTQQILDTMSLKTPGFWTWYTKNDRYSKQILNADLQAIRSLYLQRGFLDFNFKSTQVSLSPDRKEIRLVVELEEGQPYRVGTIKLIGKSMVFGTLAGGWAQLELELMNKIKLKAGQVYNGDLLNESLRDVREILEEKGFAFADIDPSFNLNKDVRELDLVINIDPKRKVFVRRIEITGNTQTKDEVIRREVVLFEGGLFNGKSLQKSKEKIERTGFFSEVSADVKRVVDSEDQLDLVFTVQETSNTTLSATLSYSSLQKLGLGLSASSRNLFGSGKEASLSVDTSTANRQIALSVLDPFFTDDGISQSLSFYQRRQDSSKLLTNYLIRTDYGVAVRYGFPISDENRIFVGANAERTRLKVDPQLSSPQYIAYVDEFGDLTNSLILNVGWSKDSRDNRLITSKGHYFSIDAERTIWGDLSYGRASLNYQYFKPIFKSQVLAFNLSLAGGRAYQGQTYPFFKNYFAGGLGSVRGYEYGSLGPKDVKNQNIGGNKRAFFNFEWLSPLPGLSKDKSLRFLLFADGGYAWGEDQTPKISDLRYSRGFGISWISPIGPLKFTWGYPINAKLGDQVSRFEFNISSGF